MTLVDYHLHSTFSCDARASMEQHCRTAVDRGVAEIGFAEHLEFDPTDKGYGFLDVARYQAELERCRGRFDGALIIRAGVEVTYQREYAGEIRRTLAAMDLDFVIGSVHLVGDGNMTDGRYVGDYFERQPAGEAYGAYFDLLAEAAGSGLFDILGHLDVAKKYGVRSYGPFRYADFAGPVDRVLRAAVRAGMVLEVNASGLRQNPGETYPGADTLARFRELGGRGVTLGSDGHVVKHGCWGLEEAARAARDAGFTSFCRFEGRQPVG